MNEKIKLYLKISGYLAFFVLFICIVYSSNYYYDNKFLVPIFCKFLLIPFLLIFVFTYVKYSKKPISLIVLFGGGGLFSLMFFLLSYSILISLNIAFSNDKNYELELMVAEKAVNPTKNSPYIILIDIYKDTTYQFIDVPMDLYKKINSNSLIKLYAKKGILGGYFFKKKNLFESLKIESKVKDKNKE